ncbi:MAG: hypothetical protein K2X69_04935 [Silvanigrellaceae bacterium]|nr:hypothetical protein [Silvanigrellaceae bacterium]
MIYKNALSIGMSLAVVMLNSCSRGGESSPKAKKQVRTNLSLNHSATAINTYTVEAEVVCGSDTSIYSITNVDSKFEVVNGEDCTIKINRFNYTDATSNTQDYNSSTALTLLYDKANTVSRALTHGEYTKTTDSNTKKYLNGVKTSESDPLTLVLLDFASEALSTWNELSTTQKEFKFNEVKLPNPLSLRLIKNSFKVNNNASPNINHTLSKIIRGNTTWPTTGDNTTGCKIITDKKDLTPSGSITTFKPVMSTYNGVNNAYNAATGSKDCSDITLGDRDNWKDLKGNDQYIVLANVTSIGNSYRVIKIPKSN